MKSSAYTLLDSTKYNSHMQKVYWSWKRIYMTDLVKRARGATLRWRASAQTQKSPLLKKKKKKKPQSK